LVMASSKAKVILWQSSSPKPIAPANGATTPLTPQSTNGLLNS
jgi:hypothetical protein